MPPTSSTRSLPARSTSPEPKEAPPFWLRCRLPTAQAGCAQGPCAPPLAMATGTTRSLVARHAACWGHGWLRGAAVRSNWRRRLDGAGIPSIATVEGSSRTSSPLLTRPSCRRPWQEAYWSEREQLLIPYSQACPVRCDKLKAASPVLHPLAPSALARHLARLQLHTREEGQLRRRLLATGRSGRGAPLAGRLG
jgi:hypothetical protein